MNRLKYYNYVLIVAVLAILPVAVPGQSSVNIKAGVSETVALSAAPNLLPGHSFIESSSDRKTVTITLSGSGPMVSTVRIPLLIRSNSGYVLTALARSKAVLANVFVSGVGATGRFVAPDAVARANVATGVDGRQSGTLSGPMPLDLVSPFSILRGTRISLAGTLDSPDNAIEVSLLITLRPEANAEVWQTQLTFTASNDGQP